MHLCVHDTVPCCMNGGQGTNLGSRFPPFILWVLGTEFRSSDLVGDASTCFPALLLHIILLPPGSFLGFCCLNLYSTISFLRHFPSRLSSCPSSPTRLTEMFHSSLRTPPEATFLQLRTHTPGFQKTGTTISVVY